MSRIAVLITCHNRKNKTLNCLERLHNQDVPLDYYVTDDGCLDGTAEAIVQSYPDVHIIQGDGNLFWNRGMRLAWIEAAKCDYDFYLWMNDDTYVFEESVRMMLDESSKLQDKAILVGASCSPDNMQVTTFGADFRNRARFPNGKIQEIDAFGGNFVLIPRYVYERVGILDNHYSHALGDIDYARMAVSKGIKIYLAPKHTGICEYDTKVPKWRNRDVPFIKRCKLLYTPLSYSNPNEFFYFYKKHDGIVSALLHYVSIHLKLFKPL